MWRLEATIKDHKTIERFVRLSGSDLKDLKIINIHEGTRGGYKFTPEQEDEILAATLSIKELAAKYGKTERSIEGKRYQLRKKGRGC